jgi:hypothetical protein
LTITGGKTIGYADPPIIEPPNDELGPDLAYEPRIDMDKLVWKSMLGYPDEYLTFNLPSVTRFGPDDTSDDSKPAIAWVTGCAFLEAHDFSEDGLAKSTFLYSWGDPSVNAWDASTTDTKVTYVYEEEPGQQIVGTTPEADAASPFRYEQDFPFNSASSAQVTYVDPKVDALVNASKWVAGGTAVLLLADLVGFAFGRRSKDSSKAGT